MHHVTHLRVNTFIVPLQHIKALWYFIHMEISHCNTTPWNSTLCTYDAALQAQKPCIAYKVHAVLQKRHPKASENQHFPQPYESPSTPRSLLRRCESGFMAPNHPLPFLSSAAEKVDIFKRKLKGGVWKFVAVGKENIQHSFKQNIGSQCATNVVCPLTYFAYLLLIGLLYDCT